MTNTDASEDELLPCPFCGSEAYFNEIEHGACNYFTWDVMCRSCEASSGDWSEKDKAATDWNTRHGLTRDEVERLVALAYNNTLKLGLRYKPDHEGRPYINPYDEQLGFITNIKKRIEALREKLG